MARHHAQGPAPLSAGRACATVVASALAPGSGHVMLGMRRTGWALLALYLVTVAAGVTLAVVAWRSWETLVPYAVRPDWISGFQRTVLVVGGLWVLVVLSATWIVLRRARGAGVRVLTGGLALGLCVVVAVPTAALAERAGTTNAFIDGVFVQGRTPSGAKAPVSKGFSDPVFSDGRLNVLLIGGDAGEDRTGLRSDTMILASTDVESGRTVLFSLPRNMQSFSFAPGSVMAEQFPDGFRECGFDGADGTDECLLNSVYTWGAQHGELFPDVQDPGAAALSSAVEWILDQPVEYWALVDLRGFRQVIDALGGVTINVAQRLPIGGVGSPVSGYIEPGLQHLDGYHALWYARSREGSTDYARVDRQRCLIGAVAREADPLTLLRNYQDVASSTEDAVETSIPQNVLSDLVTLGLRVKGRPISSVTLTPPLVPSTADPDFERIHFLVRRALADEEERRPPSDSPSPSASPSPSRSRGNETPAPTPSSTGGPVDLSSVCSYE